ncbi:MAG: Tn3 family transposase [Verrucomicrobia bacterium]|nr:Tn3 family transposase [Verrucomicrobiota bacterium]
MGRAIGELGRIPKTLHLLNFIADPNCRRHILNQLNRGNLPTAQDLRPSRGAQNPKTLHRHHDTIRTTMLAVFL